MRKSRCSLYILQLAAFLVFSFPAHLQEITESPPSETSTELPIFTETPIEVFSETPPPVATEIPSETPTETATPEVEVTEVATEAVEPTATETLQPTQPATQDTSSTVAPPIVATSSPSEHAQVSASALQAFQVLQVQSTFRTDTSGGLAVSDVAISKNRAFGMVVIRAPEGEHGGPQIILFLALKRRNQWRINFENTPEFTALLRRTPTGLIPEEAKHFMLAQGQIAADGARGSGSSQLTFPWPQGESRTWTWGPHSNGFSFAGSLNEEAALDFAGGSGQIVAARHGIVWRSASCPNFIRIDHDGGAESWYTGYYHVANEVVSSGQSVRRGQLLGYQSTAVGCGGTATGPHVHFMLWRHGAGQSWYRRHIHEWMITGTNPNTACMTNLRDRRVVCVGGTVPHEGITNTGNLLANPGFEEGNVNDHVLPWYFWGNCPWATSYPGSHTGSRLLSSHIPSGSTCQSVAQDIMIIPQPGETYTFSIWARKGFGGDAHRDFRLALWTLGGVSEGAPKRFKETDSQWTCYSVTLRVQNGNHTGLRAEIYFDNTGQPDYDFDTAVVRRGTASPCPAVSGAPKLTHPANTNVPNLRPRLTWAVVPNATFYRVQVDDNRNFSSPVDNIVISGREFTTSMLANKRKYYWRVQAISGADAPGAWSRVRWFRVDTSPPKLAKPKNNSSTRDITPKFCWRPSKIKSAHYEIEINSSNSSLKQTVTGRCFTPAQPLSRGVTYFWRVRVMDAVGNSSGWSEVRNVRIR